MTQDFSITHRIHSLSGHVMALTIMLMPPVFAIAPTLTTPVTEATQDEIYTYVLSATNVDTDNDFLTYTVPTLPNWLSFQSNAITTIAGGGNTTSISKGDKGPAKEATFYYPTGITTDNAGNIYLADTQNQHIRKIESNGIISSIAGIFRDGYNGDSRPAIGAQLSLGATILKRRRFFIYSISYIDALVKIS
jgi:hypothetical protein